MQLHLSRRRRFRPWRRRADVQSEMEWAVGGELPEPHHITSIRPLDFSPPPPQKQPPARAARRTDAYVRTLSPQPSSLTGVGLRPAEPAGVLRGLCPLHRRQQIETDFTHVGGKPRTFSHDFIKGALYLGTWNFSLKEGCFVFQILLPV